ncbi:MAG: glycosyltransferase family 39 protein [Candidatus Auribacterota bacterium]|nr:glycosyltransferase family 39 protein [Candidatus Auribacterota bacterium]
MNKNAKNRFPFLLLFLSIVVQLGALFYIFNPGVFFYKYWELALRLRGVIPPAIEVFYSSPFYICFLAFFQGMGVNYLNIQIIQILLGAFDCWLIYRAGWVFFNRPVGIIASLMAVFYGPFIIYNSSFLPSVWVITFNLVFLICLGNYARGRKPIHLIVAGLFIGLSVITRPNIAIFLFLLVPWLLANSEKCGVRLWRIFFLLFPTALIILPVTGYNYLNSSEFIPITASGGWVFYCGNNERVKGFDFNPPPELNDRISSYYSKPGSEKLSYLEHILSRELAQEKSEEYLGHRAAASFWLSEGISFIRENPGSYLKLLGKKLLYTVNGYEPHDVPEVMDRSQRLKPYPLIGLYILLPLALLGIIIVRPRSGGVILYLYLLSYLISFLIMYVIPRFRLPLVPIFLILAAAVLLELYNQIRGKKWSGLLRNIIILILLAILVNLTTPDIKRDREIVRPAFFHEWKGLTCMKRGEWGEAQEEFREALELNPESYQARLGLELELIDSRN